MLPEYDTIKKAQESLPREYAYPDEKFREKYSEPISILAELFKDRGGIHVIGDGECGIIARVPSRQMLDESAKASRKPGANQMICDFNFVVEVALYPSMEVLEGWFNGQYPGVFGPLALRVLDSAKGRAEMRSEKL